MRVPHCVEAARARTCVTRSLWCAVNLRLVESSTPRTLYVALSGRVVSLVGCDATPTLSDRSCESKSAAAAGKEELPRLHSAPVRANLSGLMRIRMYSLSKASLRICTRSSARLPATVMMSSAKPCPK